jgi:hypothetical protein
MMAALHETDVRDPRRHHPTMRRGSRQWPANANARYFLIKRWTS